MKYFRLMSQIHLWLGIAIGVINRARGAVSVSAL